MILVVGATAATGLPAVQELVRRGQRVRATSRDLARTRALLATHQVPEGAVELAELDLEQPRTFPRALRGVERCYVVLGGPAGPEDLVGVERRFIDAARAAGVRQYVKLSGIGARPSGPAIIERLHGTIAEHLVESGMPWTILEPSFFMQNFLGLAPAIQGGTLPLPAGRGAAGLIDARDVGRVAAAVLTGEGHLGQRYVLTGPELLDHARAAEVLSGVLGWRVAFADVPEAGFREGMAAAGLPPWLAERLADVYAKVLAPGRAARLTGEVERLTGRPPTGLAEFLRDHRLAFPAPARAASLA